MPTTHVNVVFEGPEMYEGVPLRDLNETLKRVQGAVRLMTAHLAGVSAQGRPPEWVRRQSSLRLLDVFPGSFGAKLGLSPLDARLDTENYGAAALDAILEWDGEDNWSLPREVIERINAIGFNLSHDVQRVRLDDPILGRQIVIKRTRRERRQPRYGSSHFETEILLHGRLMEVNWKSGTAELHNYGESPVSLRFEASLNEDMRQLATRYVAVRGIGRFNTRDEWETIDVREIKAERSVLDNFYSREPKIFDPEKATSFYQHDDDDPVDIEEFIRVIYEARDL